MVQLTLVYFDGQRYHIADYKVTIWVLNRQITSPARLRTACRCRAIGYRRPVSGGTAPLPKRETATLPD